MYITLNLRKRGQISLEVILVIHKTLSLTWFFFNRFIHEITSPLSNRYYQKFIIYDKSLSTYATGHDRNLTELI